jgi:hypothetical protein
MAYSEAVNNAQPEAAAMTRTTNTDSRQFATIGELERAAGVTDRETFWQPYAGMPGDTGLDAGAAELRRRINAADDVRRFEVGQVYRTNLACSSSTWLVFKVTKRTDKSVWLAKRHPGTGEYGEPTRRSLRLFGGRETCSPDGNYSMAPVLGADDLCS